MGYEYLGDLNPNQSFMLMYVEREYRVDAYVKKGPQPSEALGPCFKCHGDHWVSDCPMEQLEKG